MKLSQTYLLCLVFLLVAGNSAMAQCPNCTITLPPMPVDTVYLGDFPDAYQNQYYEEEVSFRLPMTTTPLAVLQPGTPTGISLTGFEVVGISGLPLGMTFKLDRPLPAMYNETSPDTRDGCVTVCGTPLQSDSFEIIISVMVHTGILAPQSASIPVSFYVHPDTSAGFTASNTSGCPPLTVSFTNNVEPDTAFGQSATYSWNFGEGTSSTAQHPADVTYTTPGTYNVDYQAIITTTIEQTFLTSVTVNGVGCTDPFGAVDLFLTITGSQTGVDTVTSYALNTAPPVSFSFGTDIFLEAGTSYSIWVQDDDAISSGFPPPADCGTVTFSADTTANTFTLVNGSLSVSVTLAHNTSYEYDTVNTTAYVVVDNCSGVDEMQAIATTLNAYPNPTDGYLQVEFTTADNAREEVELKITDVLGRTIAQKQLGNFVGTYNDNFDLSNNGPGIYTMQVRVGNSLMYRKIVVR